MLAYRNARIILFTGITNQAFILPLILEHTYTLMVSWFALATGKRERHSAHSYLLW
jgi:hypothetical protein